MRVQRRARMDVWELSEREGTYVDVRHGEMRGGLRRWVERRWWSEMNPGEEPTPAWLAILILRRRSPQPRSQILPPLKLRKRIW